MECEVWEVESVSVWTGEAVFSGSCGFLSLACGQKGVTLFKVLVAWVSLVQGFSCCRWLLGELEWAGRERI